MLPSKNCRAIETSLADAWLVDVVGRYCSCKNKNSLIHIEEKFQELTREEDGPVTRSCREGMRNRLQLEECDEDTPSGCSGRLLCALTLGAVGYLAVRNLRQK